jgi:hypothetical protein
LQNAPDLSGRDRPTGSKAVLRAFLEENFGEKGGAKRRTDTKALLAILKM